ncbi:hypothetical protein EVAR_47661_1 [Eumeta japonica]|uniref:Uncharacterized protein n=1 Tax=Eumeta variegata TaxID=151549 RepID=A0A4C1Y2P2_EUMVA|nr:hypothetical protein EVAR_47661_1 [Eumeta japonica]
MTPFLFNRKRDETLAGVAVRDRRRTSRGGRRPQARPPGGAAAPASDYGAGSVAAARDRTQPVSLRLNKSAVCVIPKRCATQAPRAPVCQPVSVPPRRSEAGTCCPMMINSNR